MSSLWGGLYAAEKDSGENVRPLAQAHAHNDYEHARPLEDALAHGFCSVEADIHLVQGELLVGHDLGDTRVERTLESLYLDPLLERARRNDGRIYPGGPGFHLLVDIKSEANATYEVLRSTLQRYREILTEFRSDQQTTRAVTVILSGNRPRERMQEERVRYAGYDGRLSDLDSGLSPHFMPWISDRWGRIFSWNGRGQFSSDQRERLDQIIRRADDRGYAVRFWGTPETEQFWQVAVEAGVDWINTDDLGGLQRFLESRPATGQDPSP